MPTLKIQQEKSLLSPRSVYFPLQEMRPFARKCNKSVSQWGAGISSIGEKDWETLQRAVISPTDSIPDRSGQKIDKSDAVKQGSHSGGPDAEGGISPSSKRDSEPTMPENRNAIPMAGGERLGERHWGESEVLPREARHHARKRTSGGEETARKYPWCPYAMSGM